MYAFTADTIGPLARTVEDVALFLRATAGYDPRDPLTSTRPVLDYAKALTGDLKGMRLAVVKELTWTETVDPEVREAIQAVVRVLTSLGAAVEEVSLPLAQYSVPLLMLTSDADVASMLLPNVLRARWYDVDYGIRTRVAVGCLIPASVYSRAMRGRALVRREVLEALQRYDALLSPTTPSPPPRIDASKEKLDAAADMDKKVLLRRMQSYPFSIANTPAISVPCGFTLNGLPLSLQIVARPFAEETVFRVAHAYEQATPWHTRHPDLERTAAEVSPKEAGARPAPSTRLAVRQEEAGLTTEQVRQMARVVRLDIPEPDINDVTVRLAALLSCMEEIDRELGPRLETVDPVPPVFPHEDF